MNWEIQKKQGQCTSCEKAFQDQEEQFSLLQFREDHLVRDDICIECWHKQPPAEDAIFWKTRFQAVAKKKKINFPALRELFLKMCEKPDPGRQALHYLIALLLVRKKFLRIRKIERTSEGDVLRCGVPRGEEVYHIPVPPLDPAKMDYLKEELRALFETPEDAPMEFPDPASQEAENQEVTPGDASLPEPP